MNQLIWFSIPGGIIAASLLICFPEWRDKAFIEPSYLIAGVIGVGFILHQFTRVFLEGIHKLYENPIRRPVLRDMMNALKPALENGTEASHIWDVVFHSDGIPSAFRDHDRAMWHYVMGFWGMMVACVVAAFIAVLACLDGEHKFCIILIFLVFAAVFWWKAKLTFDSWNRQEIYLFKIYHDVFQKHWSKRASAKEPAPKRDRAIV